MNNTLIETQNLPQPTDGKITTPQPPSAEDKALATKIGLMGGAASGVATGVAVGAATAGPVGAAVGGVIGAVAGAVGGKALVDNIGPASDDDNYWANAHVREPYYHPGTPYAWYRPAYEHGWQGAERYPGSYGEAELQLREDWLYARPQHGLGRGTPGGQGRMGARRHASGRRRGSSRRPR